MAEPRIMQSVQQHHWRRWAIMRVLFETTKPLTAREIAHKIKRQGWDVFTDKVKRQGWDASPRGSSPTELVQKTLMSDYKRGEMKRNFSKSQGERPARWILTGRGLILYETSILNNHHITPEKSQKEGAYQRGT